MKRNKITKFYRNWAQMLLEKSIQLLCDHEMEEPYCSFDHTTYNGDTEPILHAINRAYDGGMKSKQRELDEAIALLEEYEQWEADVLNEDSLWQPYREEDGIVGELYDKMMELQKTRNKILGRERFYRKNSK